MLVPAVLIEAAVSLSNVMRNNFEMLSKSGLQLTAKLFEVRPCLKKRHCLARKNIHLSAVRSRSLSCQHVFPRYPTPQAEPGAEMDAVRAWSYYLRQILVYFQLLQGDLAQSAERLAQAVVAIEERQAKLKSTVEAKVAVPTDQVYVGASNIFFGRIEH
jgi:hypothetical protein